MSDAVTLREPQDVPTFSECVVGYRAWRADMKDLLWPLHSTRRPWSPGVNTARCNCRTSSSLRFEWSWHEGRRVLEPAPEHDAPGDHCVCGLYSLRHPRKAWFDTPAWSASRHVVGAVASWGHIQVHNAGFRAEHACIVTLAYHPDTPPDGLQALERIAARYRVELVPLAELSRQPAATGAPYRRVCIPSDTMMCRTSIQRPMARSKLRLTRRWLRARQAPHRVRPTNRCAKRTAQGPTY